MNNETWKTIKEYPDYQISSFGRVKSFYKHNGTSYRTLKQNKDKDGYFYICLYKNGNKKTKRINIIVYETFYNNKLKSDECVHHKDENKENNCYNNLEKINK